MHTFALVSDARSGTAMLSSALKTHPCIETIDFSGVLTRQLEVQRDEYATPGCTHMGTVTHVWAPHFITTVFRMQPEEFWEWLRGAHEKVIVLQRRNVLCQYLSCLVLTQTKRHKPFDARVAVPEPVTIDVTEFRKHIEGLNDRRLPVEDACPDRLDISYGDLINHWQETVQTVQSYIGVEPMDIQTTAVRQETRSLRIAIRNYADVATWLRRYGHEDWLIEPEE